MSIKPKISIRSLCQDKLALLFLASYIVSPASLAEENTELSWTLSHEITLSAQQMSSNWREYEVPVFEADEELLNEEDGSIPGFGLSYKIQITPLVFAGIKAFSTSGEVDYLGFTTGGGGGGSLVQSTSDYDIQDFSILVGGSLDSIPLKPKFYIGAGDHDRNRLINDVIIPDGEPCPVALNADGDCRINGLDETYTWGYRFYGTELELATFGKFGLHFNAEFIKLNNPKVHVISAGWGTTTPSLGYTKQRLVGFKLSYKASDMLQIALSHSLRKTRVNRGERANWILEDGTESIFTAYQPRTRFNEKAFNLEATFRF